MTSEALVLRVLAFGESDRIVHLLLPGSGRLSAIAKGARRSVRRFPGTLDVFNRVRVQLATQRRTGGLARLEQAALVSLHAGLRTSPPRFALGCYLVELLDRLAPEQAAPREAARLYGFALAALRLLESAPPDARLRVLLELRALDALGLRPELDRCVRCGREPGDGFDVAGGGALCAVCTAREPAALRVRRGTLRALAQGLRLEPEQLARLALDRRALAEASVLVERFQRFHVGVELKSERFLAQTLPVATPA